MKMLQVLIPMSMAATLISGTAAAVEQGSGQITFEGSVINAACSISAETADQTVELGQISITDLTNGDKKSTPHPFDITLENCVLDDTAENVVTVTFTGQGASFNSEILGVTGTASGAGVAIAEQNSSDSYLPLGAPSSELHLGARANTMHFSAYVMADTRLVGMLKKPTEGDFTAVTNFTLSYQ